MLEAAYQSIWSVSGSVASGGALVIIGKHVLLLQVAPVAIIGKHVLSGMQLLITTEDHATLSREDKRGATTMKTREG